MSIARLLGGVSIGVLLLGMSPGCIELRTPDPDVIYLAFGDSTTAGPSSRDYPDILRELLDMPAATFANEGQGGEETDEGLERLERLLNAEIFPNAQVMLYWEGGNEITDFIANNDPLLTLTPTSPGFPFASRLDSRLDEAQQNIERAIAAAQDVGMDVYVATYFSIRETLDSCPALPFELLFPGQASNANQYVILLNDRIRDAAENGGAVLVDIATLNAELTSSAANFENCSHLSAAGNAIAAELFFDRITVQGG